MGSLYTVGRTRLAWLALILSGTLSGTAQDASISPLEWTHPKGAPDEMPALLSKPRLTFPEALRSTPDIGYVVTSITLDTKGRILGAFRVATERAYERVYEEGLEQFKFSPGRREGVPVTTAVSLAVFFHPASAAVDKPDATPRLIDVSTVVLPWPQGAKATDVFEDQVVFANVTVDEAGRIAAVNEAPPEFREKIILTAKRWRFAPARRGGQPVAATIRVPFVIQTMSGPNAGSGPRIPPRVIAQTPPLYPILMRASGMRGEVVVDFYVDIEGRVQNAFVARSLNPAFDDPALEAVRKWRFEPGRDGQKPVRTHMQVPVMFQLPGLEDGGSDGMVVRKKPDLSKLPEELRYDTPPRLIGSVRPVFPHSLLNAGTNGKASVRYLVNEAGRVVQATVVEASAPEFGAALLAAIELFTYEPAVKAGRPSKALLGFSMEFSRDESFQIVAPEDVFLLRREQKKPETIVAAGELDEPLNPLSRRPARFPLSRVGDGVPGEAMIEFLIDEDGRARLPRVVSATHEAFGYAAAQSVASWRFEPPTRGGKSVTARAKVPIRFNVAAPDGNAGK